MIFSLSSSIDQLGLLKVWNSDSRTVSCVLHRNEAFGPVNTNTSLQRYCSAVAARIRPAFEPILGHTDNMQS